MYVPLRAAYGLEHRRDVDSERNSNDEERNTLQCLAVTVNFQALRDQIAMNEWLNMLLFLQRHRVNVLKSMRFNDASPYIEERADISSQIARYKRVRWQCEMVQIHGDCNGNRRGIGRGEAVGDMT